MTKIKMHVYYDKEGDYLEIRFGKPTESYYAKIGPDTFIRIDKKTQEERGVAIFNVSKGNNTKSLEIDLPLSLLKLFKTHNY